MVIDQDSAGIDCLGRSDGFFASGFDLAGDVNGDGRQDIIVTHRDDRSTDAYVFFNTGDGRFGLGASEAPRGVNVLLDSPELLKLCVSGLGDFNGDTQDDLAVLVKIPNGNFELHIYR